jgi:hypothetical protein
MSPVTFFRPNLLNQPGIMKPWQTGDGQTFREVIAGELDATIIAAEQVADARNVLKCDPTILPYHAKDRMMPRFSTVDESVWRTMLSKFRQIHATAGHPWCLLRLLRIFLRRFGRPMLRYVSTAGDGSFSQWHTLAPGDGTNDYFELGRTDPEFTTHTEDPANWLWDAQASTGHWSRFWILIYTSDMTGVNTTTDWDDTGEWDGGVDFWDGYIESDEIAEMVTMLNTFKASNSQLQGLFLVHDDSIFDPSGSGAGFPGGNWNIDGNRVGNVSYSHERT